MSKTAKRYADFPALQITLNNDQLRQLGTLYAVWGQIDFDIVIVIAQILRIEPKAAIALLDNVTGSSTADSG